jgi:hypothetical protein
MTETQTPIQRFEEQTRKTYERTKESIKNLLDKMRNSKLGLDEPKVEPEAESEVVEEDDQ